MAESVALPSTPANPRRALHFEWVIPVLIRPRAAFAEIAAQPRGVWLAPILILTLCALLQVLMAGYVNSTTGAIGNVELPDEFYYTEQDQAQFGQNAALMQGPLVVYMLPSILAVIVVWGGWLIFGSILHLILTLLGGRSTTGITMNIVAWASLPLAVRFILQFLWLLITRQPIVGAGFSGLLPATGGTASMIAASCLALFDIFLIWQIVLLVFGIRASSGLTAPRALISVLIALGIVLTLQTFIGFGGSMLSNLTAAPFF